MRSNLALAVWGSSLATFFIYPRCSPGRLDTSERPHDDLCGAKAGATFCLAMISIGSGLKPRASQRYRNNCLTLEMETGPANFLG